MLRNKTYHSCSVVPLRLYLFIYLFIAVLLEKLCVYDLTHLSLAVCIIVFFGAAWLSRAPGPPGEVLPADRQPGPAGDMPGPAAPLKSAGWLWTVAAGGGNQSVSISPPPPPPPPPFSLLLFPFFLSLYLPPLSPLLQPPAQRVSSAIESFNVPR